jgi:tetratricopeptide (TPR) repeat protein
VILVVLLAVLALGEDCQQSQTLGRRAYEDRRYAEAAGHFTSAVAACGASSALLLALGQAQLLSQRPADALASLDRIPVDDPEYVQVLKVKAKALYLLGRDPEAVATLQRAAVRAPADTEIPYDLGRMYYQQGKPAQAAEALGRAIALDPRAYKAWDALGLAREALGDVEQAQQDYLKAIALVHNDHPHYDVVYANFADLMLKRGDYQRAFDLAAEAAQRNPNEPRNLFLAGKALVQLGRTDVGVRWFEQAIVLDPDYPEPHYLLFQAYRRLGRTADADRELNAFKAAAERAPKVRR